MVVSSICREGAASIMFSGTSTLCIMLALEWVAIIFLGNMVPSVLSLFDATVELLIQSYHGGNYSI